MRVLQIINSLNTGGAEKLLLEGIPKYNSEGIKMDLLLLDGTDYPFLKQLKQLPNITIYSLGKGFIYNPLHIFKIGKYLKLYDIIHVHLFPCLYWVPFAKFLSLSNKKLLFTEHNTINRRRTNYLFKFLDRLVYSFYSKIITISEDVDKSLKEYLDFDKSKFQMIHNGIDLNAIHTAIPYEKDKLGINESERIIIQIASFTKQKDHDTIIKSLVHMSEHVKLILVGEGPLLGNCRELVKFLGLSDRIYFLGARMDVPRLLKTADIVVLSSYYEGFSLSCIEGLASGKPFIASDVKGLSFVVGGAGLLFAARDNFNLAKLITELLNDTDLYNRTVENCLMRSTEYSLDKMIEQHINLYTKLCQNQN